MPVSDSASERKDTRKLEETSAKVAHTALESKDSSAPKVPHDLCSNKESQTDRPQEIPGNNDNHRSDAGSESMVPRDEAVPNPGATNPPAVATTWDCPGCRNTINSAENPVVCPICLHYRPLPK